MKKASEFELKIQDARRRKGFTWVDLAVLVEFNSGANLNSAVINRRINDLLLVNLCESLDLDLCEMFKLKIK